MKIRGEEHKRGLKNKNKNNVLYKHVLDEHKEEEDLVEFEMVKTGSFKTAVSRQINEGIRIKNRDNKTLLNSKAEFHGPSVGRKVIDDTYKCNKCTWKFKTIHNLRYHMEVQHSLYKCKECGEMCTDRKGLKKHMNIEYKNKH